MNSGVPVTQRGRGGALSEEHKMFQVKLTRNMTSCILSTPTLEGESYTHHTTHTILTYDCLDLRSLECGKSKVSDFDKACCAIDKYVITLKISVNNWRCSGVQEVKAS